MIIKKNMARRFGSNTVNKFSGSAGFERFIYLKGNDAVLFRFKKAGIKNQPLVIYFGGTKVNAKRKTLRNTKIL